MSNTNVFKVLSIDAWGNCEDGYDWNNWFNVGEIELPESPSNEQILKCALNAGYITQIDGGDVDDDQFNYVIVDKNTREPLFAIEYGSKQ